MSGKMKRGTIPKDAVIYYRRPFDAIPDHELGHQAFRYTRPETPPTWWQRALHHLPSRRLRWPYT